MLKKTWIIFVHAVRYKLLRHTLSIISCVLYGFDDSDEHDVRLFMLHILDLRDSGESERDD